MDGSALTTAQISFDSCMSTCTPNRRSSSLSDCPDADWRAAIASPSYANDAVTTFAYGICGPAGPMSSPSLTLSDVRAYRADYMSHGHSGQPGQSAAPDHRSHLLHDLAHLGELLHELVDV